MRQGELSDAAVVLIGHGSTVTAESSAPVYQHAIELRRRRLFAEVREAFWKQPPQVKQVLASMTAARIFLVPLFISEGYFGEEVIPRALGFELDARSTLIRTQRRGDQTLLYCHPIGTHPGMTDVLLSRAEDIVHKFPAAQPVLKKETTLFIAGHGTEENQNSRKAIERQVELIQSRSSYASVQSVFLEEEPRIAHCPDLARTPNMIIVPFFISDGMHTQRDIPILLGEPESLVRERFHAGQPTWPNPSERNGKLVWYTPSIGSEPLIADIVMERVREAVKNGTME